MILCETMFFGKHYTRPGDKKPYVFAYMLHPKKLEDFRAYSKRLPQEAHHIAINVDGKGAIYPLSDRHLFVRQNSSFPGYTETQGHATQRLLDYMAGKDDDIAMQASHVIAYVGHLWYAFDAGIPGAITHNYHWQGIPFEPVEADYV